MIHGLTVQARFFSYVSKSSNCWFWTGRIDEWGYGRFNIKPKVVRAHRFAWENLIGIIPQGLHVLHKCDNRSCVNPAHLFLGTDFDNVQDMITKGRSKLDNRRRANA